MKAGGQARSEAERVAPGCDKQEEIRPEGPKYHGITPFQGYTAFDSVIQGRRARFARACPWLSYSAPLALRFDFDESVFNGWSA